ncbi:MAG TPA: acetyl-CoA carboxylase biotin carboxyl carrier protein [Longimicrobiales bacterium]|nr:acetyl-CoA carboxylase biotin carboxyl carrier protein [Longimicrobiales bacterium]
MIDLEFLERLIQAIDQSSLDSIEIERGGTRVRLSKTAGVTTMVSAPAPAAPPALQAPSPGVAGSAVSQSVPVSAAASNLLEITSPMVGTFYRSPAPDAPSYVEKGKKVSQGDTLCIIEAMKLMNELECEVAGTIVEILVENAQPVEYGQVLFRVDPS